MTKSELMMKNRKLEQDLFICRRSNEYYMNHVHRLREEAKKKDAEIEKLKEGIKWRQDGITELEDEIDKKNEEIEHLNGEIESQRETIKRMSQQLTEKELYEKKCKEWEKKIHDLGTIELTKGTQFNILMDRLCRLEAKYEAQENPYFF